MSPVPAAPLLRVEPTEPAARDAALELLLCDLDAEARRREVQRLLRRADEGALSLAGLLTARRGDGLAGVTWTQIQPGRTALLWRPQLAESDDPNDVRESIALCLTTAAMEFARGQGCQLLQAALSPDDAAAAVWYQSAGMSRLAELDYLVAPVMGASPQPPPEQGFTAVDCHIETDRARLEAILARTYVDTLDCPALGGVRLASDIVAGYLAVGAAASQHWELLQCNGHDAGCLLLADHPQSNEFEMVYFGLAPEYRGRGLGRYAIRRALWRTHAAGRARLVLAADAANAPAQRLYSASGFVRYDQRSVWVRVLA